VQCFLEGGLVDLADRLAHAPTASGRGRAEMERRLCHPPTIQAAMEAAQVSTISSD